MIGGRDYLERLDSLLKSGDFSPIETQWIEQRLYCAGGQDTVELLTWLGERNLRQFRDKIELLMYCREDAFLSSIALKVICTDWNLVSHHIDLLRTFIRGVDWDDEDDLRLCAISIAGKYLFSTSDTALLGELLAAYDQSQNDEILSGAVFRAIWMAMGRDVRDLIPHNGRTEPTSSELRQVLDEARTTVR